MQVNNRVGDIGNAIQNYVNQYGYGIVKELVGHGLGKVFMKNLKFQIMVNLELVKF